MLMIVAVTATIVKLVSDRDFRDRTAQLWRDTEQEKDLVMTNNGKPVVILGATDEALFKRALNEMRRCLADSTLRELQRDAARRRLDGLSMEEINAEIQASRKRRQGN